MKKYLLALLPLLILGFAPRPSITEDTSLEEVLQMLGKPAPKHYISPEDRTVTLVKQGEELVKEGRTLGPDGNKTPYVSLFYVCTDCHNLVQEDPDLTKSDPEARLMYAAEQNIPFLQGTTFKGTVNRETWYNDDYVKKYGELVYKANKDLGESIQLCAQECSQGRKLKDWEVKAIIAYYWSLEYSLADVKAKPSTLKALNEEELTSGTKKKLLEELRSLYMKKSPATFSDGPEDKIAGYKGVEEGDAFKGALLYKLSCQACHFPKGVSELNLDNSKFTFRKFRRNMDRDSYFNIYDIVRYGTYAMKGHKPYMPHYTLERMSHQQLEDLRAFIEQEAI
ncbi:MAG: c-type cytochrome [Bacteroidota bacterium]